jgi:hypothetical protein
MLEVCQMDQPFDRWINPPSSGPILAPLQPLTLIFRIHCIRRMRLIDRMHNIHSLHAGTNAIRIQRTKRIMECGLAAFGQSQRV